MNLEAAMKPYRDEIISIRRWLHQHPELSFKEFNTVKYLKSSLENVGVEWQVTNVETALTGIIKGDIEGPTVTIRADIDALPIIEDTDLPFTSINEGVSHACGHDLHMAMLILIAKVAGNYKEHLKGNIRILFQPAEEIGGGAKAVIADGFFDLLPKSDCILGMHTSPELKVGSISAAKGVMNASTDEIVITINSEGGHGAYPYKCADPIVAAGLLITQLQTIISRENPALDPAVLTFGYVHGGTAPNIIPTEVILRGNLRAFDDETRNRVISAVHRMAEGCEITTRTKINVVVKAGVQALINDEEITQRLLDKGAKVLGANHVVELKKPFPGSDDFACYLKEIPGVYFKFGTANENRSTQYGIHHPKNIFDEEAIFVGAAALLAFIFDI